MMQRRSLRNSLFLAIASVAAVGLLLPALAIGGLWIGVVEPMLSQRAQAEEMKAKLDLLSGSLPELLWNLDRVAAREVVAAVMIAPDVVHVRVTEANSPGAFVELGSDAQTDVRGLTGERDIVRDGVAIGSLHIGMSDQAALGAMQRQRWIYGMTVGGQLLISLALILALLNSRVMRPLRDLGRFADDLADRRFSTRLRHGLPDEIGALGRHLERMRAALQQQFGEQQSLIERLRGLADTVPGVLFQLRQADDGRFELVYLSEAALDLFGVSAETLMARPEALGSLVDERDRASIRQGLRASATSLSPWRQEFRVAANATGERWLYVDARVQPAPGGGGVVWHGFVTDISTQRRNLQELQSHRQDLEARVQQRTRELADATAAAEAANRAKTVFLHNMSHEMRTPMNAIIGLTWLLRRESGDPQQAQRLDKVTDAAQHLLGVINNVLDFSKIEAGKLQLEIAEFDTTRVLGTVDDLLAQRAADKGLALHIDADPRLDGLPLLGDAQRITEVLLNYLGNAIKFTELGQVRLRARIEALNAQSVDLRFEVEDTGIGIDPALQSRLFQDFEQVDGSRTRRHGGTGLGLAICRRLAELMRGRVGVRSAPGQGSVFWIALTLPRAPGRQLPAPDPAALLALQTEAPPDAQRPGPSGAPAQQPGAGPSAAALSSEGLRGRRILVAEDDGVNQIVATAVLESAGLVVDMASDGAQAVRMAADNDYDLILMDMQMPELDGLQASRLIRRTRRGRSVPILAMTANAFSDDRQRCLDAGMNDHVAKPVAPQQLFATLRHWLLRSQAQSGERD